MSVGTAPATSVLATRTVSAVPLDPEMSRRLLKAARRLEILREDRNATICEAHAAGASLREIGAVVGMSHVGVMKIIERYGPGTGGADHIKPHLPQQR